MPRQLYTYKVDFLVMSSQAWSEIYRGIQADTQKASTCYNLIYFENLVLKKCICACEIQKKEEINLGEVL